MLYMRCSGRSSRVSSRVRDSATPGWGSSSPPTAAPPGASSRRDCRPSCQANIAIAPSDPGILYAVVAPAQGPIGFYKSTDGGAPLVPGDSRAGRASRIGAGHAAAGAHRRRRPADGDRRSQGSQRRLQRVDRDVADARWRPDLERGTRRARRRRLPEDLDQPERHQHHPRRRRPGGRRFAEPRPQLEQLVQPEHRGDVSRHHRQRVSLSRLFGTAGFGQRLRAEPIGRRPDHVPRLAPGQHPGIRHRRAGPEPIPIIVFGSQRTGVSRYDRRTGQTTQVGPDTSRTLPGGGAMNRNVRTMPLHFSPIDGRTMYLRIERGVEERRPRPLVVAHLARPGARRPGTVPANAGKYARDGEAGRAWAASPRSARARSSIGVIWAGTDDGNIQVTRDGGVDVGQRHARRRSSPGRASSISRRATSIRSSPTPRPIRSASTRSRRTSIAPTTAARPGRRSTRALPATPSPTPSARIRASPACSIAGTDTQVWVSFDDGGPLAVAAAQHAGDLGSRPADQGRCDTCRCADLIAGTHGRGFWILDDVTPLRQAAAIKAALARNEPYLFKPGPAVRVRFGANEPTPWPPELPGGRERAARRSHRLLPAA